MLWSAIRLKFAVGMHYEQTGIGLLGVYGVWMARLGD